MSTYHEARAAGTLTIWQPSPYCTSWEEEAADIRREQEREAREEEMDCDDLNPNDCANHPDWCRCPECDPDSYRDDPEDDDSMLHYWATYPVDGCETEGTTP